MPAVHLTEALRRKAWLLAVRYGASDLADQFAFECPTHRGLTDAECPCHPSASSLVERGVVVHPSAVVEGVVGVGTVVGPNAWVGPLVTVGRDCVVGPGAQLGGDGFGYERDGLTDMDAVERGDGRWAPKPQRYGVVLGDDVRVGANACVDRGSWRDTVIGRGSRIDNLVHVAHNVHMGEDCLVIACAMLGGSVELGDGAWVAPGARVRERIKLGARSFVALGAVVVSDVADGEHVRGVPAKAFQPRAAA